MAISVARGFLKRLKIEIKNVKLDKIARKKILERLLL